MMMKHPNWLLNEDCTYVPPVSEFTACFSCLPSSEASWELADGQESCGLASDTHMHTHAHTMDQGFSLNTLVSVPRVCVSVSWRCSTYEVMLFFGHIWGPPQNLKKQNQQVNINICFILVSDYAEIIK